MPTGTEQSGSASPTGHGDIRSVRPEALLIRTRMAGYASFMFQVQDGGGVANGGVDLDATPNTITVNVGIVNDAPVGTSKTVSALEDTAYTSTEADFGFTDPLDSPANALAAVKITTP